MLYSPAQLYYYSISYHSNCLNWWPYSLPFFPSSCLIPYHVVHGGVMAIVLTTVPRFAGSNPESDGFLRAIKIRSTTSFRGEVKPSPHVVRFYGTLKITWGMTDTDRKNPAAIFRPVSPCFATGCLWCNQSIELWWMNREWFELR
jgi:hypothetical protein